MNPICAISRSAGWAALTGTSIFSQREDSLSIERISAARDSSPQQALRARDRIVLTSPVRKEPTVQVLPAVDTRPAVVTEVFVDGEADGGVAGAFECVGQVVGPFGLDDIIA